MGNLITEIRKLMSVPRTVRRRLLAESKYSLPSSGDKAIMDLYALYTLWWEEGTGKETYGYHPDTYRSNRREELVGKAFEDCLSVVGNALVLESREALKDEALQAFDPHLIDPNVIITWARKAEFLRKLAALHKGERFSYQDYMVFFAAPFWKTETDWYGGPAWAAIAEAVMKLDAAFRRGVSVQLMGAIDHLLDIEHNTGTLGSKLGKMKVKKSTLDLRAGFTSSKDFLPHVSGSVAALIRSQRTVAAG